MTCSPFKQQKHSFENWKAVHEFWACEEFVQSRQQLCQLGAKAEFEANFAEGRR